MLAEERLERIAALVDERGTVTSAELMSALDASDSTVRRDLTRLAQEGRIVKVHGGARAVGASARLSVVSMDQTVGEKHDVNLAQKMRIARYAAALIAPDDFVFIDAGSTTGFLAEAITETRATYVTNSIENARVLVERGCRVLLPAGEIKTVTGALVGEQTVETLRRFRFTVGFFGTNGATPDSGFTTPELGEALVKETALAHTLKPYVLCDSSKFSAVSPVAFAAFDDAVVITDAVPGELDGCSNVIVAE